MDYDWSPLLKCRLERYESDTAQHSAEFWLPADSCTDMDGVIRYATKLDPDCKLIITWSGGKRDTCYFKTGDKWEARL